LALPETAPAFVLDFSRIAPPLSGFPCYGSPEARRRVRFSFSMVQFSAGIGFALKSSPTAPQSVRSFFFHSAPPQAEFSFFLPLKIWFTPTYLLLRAFVPLVFLLRPGAAVPAQSSGALL
jgi:hypothetical protein